MRQFDSNSNAPPIHNCTRWVCLPFLGPSSYRIAHYLKKYNYQVAYYSLLTLSHLSCLRIPPLPWTAAECIRSSAHVAISISAKQGDHLKRDSLSIKMTTESHQQLLSTASVITMTSVIPPFPSCTPPPRAVSLIDLKK